MPTNKIRLTVEVVMEVEYPEGHRSEATHVMNEIEKEIFRHTREAIKTQNAANADTFNLKDIKIVLE